MNARYKRCFCGLLCNFVVETSTVFVNDPRWQAMRWVCVCAATPCSKFWARLVFSDTDGVSDGIPAKDSVGLLWDWRRIFFWWNWWQRRQIINSEAGVTQEGKSCQPDIVSLPCCGSELERSLRSKDENGSANRGLSAFGHRCVILNVKDGLDGHFQIVSTLSELAVSRKQ